MPNFLLSCCSTADLSDDFFNEIDVPYICFHFIMDGETYPDDLGKTMPLKTFYDRVRGGALPTTSQVNVQQYMDFFEPHLKEGRDILHLTLSSGVSGAYNSACTARDELMQKYPDRKLFTVDSICASAGYGLLVYLASKMRKEGKSIDEVHYWAEVYKYNIQHWVSVSDLSHLKRGGRISSVSAIAGSVLNICPLLDINSEGRLVQRKKIRGKKQAAAEMVKIMEELADGGTGYQGPVFISNSDCEADAEYLAGLIKEKFPKIEGGAVRIFNIGTVIGSHTGPGTTALFYCGAKRGL